MIHGQNNKFRVVSGLTCTCYVVTIELSFVFRVPIFFLVKDAGWSTNHPSDLLQNFDMFDHE